MQIHSIPGFSEPFSAMSHLAGALIFTILSLRLLGRGRGDGLRVLFLGIFAFSCVLLLSMSGVYHMLAEGSAARAVLGRLDRAAIFVLIAGTHTPIQGFFFRGAARWGVLTVMWLLVAAGITMFNMFYHSLPSGLGTTIYLSLGWVAGVFGIMVWRRYGTKQTWPLLVGGFVYTIGAILLILGWPTLIPGVLGPHELWHVAVLAALTLHWTFIFRHAHLPME